MKTETLQIFNRGEFTDAPSEGKESGESLSVRDIVKNQGLEIGESLPPRRVLH